MSKIKVALAGIGGYGDWYVDQIMGDAAAQSIEFAGAIDPQPERSRNLARLKDAGVPLYTDFKDFLAAGTADLVILAVPIHLHAPYTCMALERGMNVLCEKPIAATVQEADEMLAAEKASGKFVAIGYQWPYTDAIQSLKADILAGNLGAPVNLRGCVLWPRTHKYYARSSWAGQLKSPDGRWILDSPANNATAHYLQVMLYLLGDSIETAAEPANIEAELYHANDIPSFDTAAISCRAAGANILFLTSHAVDKLTDPTFRWKFEHAVVEYSGSGDATLRAVFNDGSQVAYGSPNDTVTNKITRCVQAVRGEASILCGIQAARANTLCIEAAHASSPIQNFPADLVATEARDGGDQLTYVRGLHDAMLKCFEENRMGIRPE